MPASRPVPARRRLLERLVHKSHPPVLTQRLPPASKRCWSLCPSSWLLEKLPDGHTQCLSQTVQHIHRWIFFSPFQSAHIGTVNTRIECQRFLRQALPNPDPAQIPSNQCSPVHARRRALSWLSNHGI